MTETMTAPVLDEGVPLGGLVFDFVGAGVTVTAAAGKVTISIPGGAGSESHIVMLAVASEVTF